MSDSTPEQVGTGLCHGDDDCNPGTNAPGEDHLLVQVQETS